MAKVSINTVKNVIPMMYGYVTPHDHTHDGWIKIGYTDKQTVEDRINQQTHTSDTYWEFGWKKTAVYDDGTGDSFTDHQFHAYLKKLGIERKDGTEWFHLSSEESKQHLIDFKENRGILTADGTTIPYELRNEQDEAVSNTIEYFESTGEKAEFLWNCKPRFGKTLSAYTLAKKMADKVRPHGFHVLIVTNRPAIANSWYEDYVKFMGSESKFSFVSSTDSLKNKPYVMSRDEYNMSLHGKKPDEWNSSIEFISLQDLKGSIHFGGQYDKLKYIKELEWGLLIIDEAHEGVDTFKTDSAFYQIKRKYTLHLSGTPFKALANDKFKDKAIYNWTYADEQKAKAEWDETVGTNPYERLPKLNLFTYQMSEMIRDEVKKGIEINEETEEYAFDLNEFFATNANGSFMYEESVDKFLDSLTKFEKYPFSTPELRNELKHTLWLLNRVDSAKALAKKLKKHPVFENYEVVLAAGDGKLDDMSETKKSFDKVRSAIENHDKTITLSVGQLTTGVTIPEWTAVLMLSNCKSPALYMQTAFRSQNPWEYHKEGKHYIKDNAYVFDFDPARTLSIFEEFANDLSSNTSGGKGDSDTRKQNVRELLNFFPVIGEDENGEMIELDAEKVLSIPRKIRSIEVVRRGFMCNFLFQNIGNIFNAPQAVLDIITNFEPISEGKPVDVSQTARQEVPVDEQGEIAISDEQIIEKSEELFGEKIYGEIENAISDSIQENQEIFNKENSSLNEMINTLTNAFDTALVAPIIDQTKETYGNELNRKEISQIEKHVQQTVEGLAKKEASQFSIQKKELEHEKQNELDNRIVSGKTEEEIQEEYMKKAEEATQSFMEKIETTVKEAMESITKEVVEKAETKKIEHKKDTIEDAVRNHLRGFSRTIPSFLMAYGDENTTLETFDSIIPDEVFKEVTSISLEEFKFLRDGGDYTDATTGEKRHYQGKLFDSVVFNDSVQEFLRLKDRLSDYFDETQEEDIFDYIPPQKTNQIFTPKRVVKQMVDMLEEENPGCFDDPEKTFADLYMKSGLYITEIVKRLYQSEKIKALYPNENERLKHIFEKQVYGLAPTEIIYRIAISFILGFDHDIENIKHNFRMLDSLPYAKNGTLEEKLNEIF